MSVNWTPTKGNRSFPVSKAFDLVVPDVTVVPVVPLVVVKLYCVWFLGSKLPITEYYLLSTYTDTFLDESITILSLYTVWAWIVIGKALV